MTDLTSFRAIVELWPSREEMGTDTGASGWLVSKWWQRDKIPAEWWASVISSSRAREAGVTAELLTALAAREAVEDRA